MQHNSTYIHYFQFGCSHFLIFPLRLNIPKVMVMFHKVIPGPYICISYKGLNRETEREGRGGRKRENITFLNFSFCSTCFARAICRKSLNSFSLRQFEVSSSTLSSNSSTLYLVRCKIVLFLHIHLSSLVSVEEEGQKMESHREMEEWIN